MEMNDLNRGTNTINDDNSDERERLLDSGNRRGRSPGTPAHRKAPIISGMIGNFKPKGGDKVNPPDIHFSYIASFFIIAPTLYVMGFS